MVQKYAKHQMKNEKQPMNFNIMPKWRNFATSGHSALGSLYDTSSLSSTSCRLTRSRGEVGDGVTAFVKGDNDQKIGKYPVKVSKIVFSFYLFYYFYSTLLLRLYLLLLLLLLFLLLILVLLLLLFLLLLLLLFF